MQNCTSKLYYGRYKIYLKTEDLESISDKLNPFRRDIVLNLSDFLPIKDEEENNIINIMSQPIKAKKKNMCVYGHPTHPICQPPTLTLLIGNYSTLIFANDPINIYTEFG